MSQIAAPYRVKLWVAKKPYERLTRYVNETDLIGAAICAQQWLSWANESGRGKRSRYNRFIVEERDESGAWVTVREGEFHRAKMEQQEKDAPKGKKRPIQLADVANRQGHGNSRAARNTPRYTGTGRLADIVRRVKQGK